MSARLRNRIAKLEARRVSPDRCDGPFRLLTGDAPFAPSDEHRCPRCGDFHVVAIVEEIVASHAEGSGT